MYLFNLCLPFSREYVMYYITCKLLLSYEVFPQVYTFHKCSQRLASSVSMCELYRCVVECPSGGRCFLPIVVRVSIEVGTYIKACEKAYLSRLMCQYLRACSLTHIPYRVPRQVSGIGNKCIMLTAYNLEESISLRADCSIAR